MKHIEQITANLDNFWNAQSKVVLQAVCPHQATVETCWSNILAAVEENQSQYSEENTCLAWPGRYAPSQYV